MTRRIRLLTLATALLAALAAAPAQAAPPKRVVALTPFGANTLANLGVRPVGIGETVGGAERFSRKLRGVKRLPLSHPNGPNMEQLATLNPDLVLSTKQWQRGEATMRELQIKVRRHEPITVPGAAIETQRIGKLVGKSSRAKTLVRSMRNSVKKATRRIRNKPRVLVILGVGRTPFAFLSNSWGGDVVKRAGGRLLTQGLEAPGGFARISNETVVERNPDVIIAVPHANTKDVPELKNYLQNNPAWAGTKAAQNKRIYVSTNNALLQAGTDIARTIKTVRKKYLKN